MIIDKQLKLSDSQAVTATAASDQFIDQGSAGNAYGNEMFLVIQTREAVTAAGAATVNFQIETASDAAFTSPTVAYDSGSIGKALLGLNTHPVQTRLPMNLNRYFRVKYVVGTGPLTAGKFDAFLTPDVQVTQ